MRSTILFLTILLSGIATLNAQILKYQQEKGTFDFGIKAGLSTSILTSTQFGDRSIRVGMAGGVFTRYGITERFWLQAGIDYAQRGAGFSQGKAIVGPSLLIDEMHLDAIDIPLTAIYNIRYTFMKKPMHFDVFAGLAPTYFILKEINGNDAGDALADYDVNLVAGSGFTLGKIILYATTKIGLNQITNDYLIFATRNIKSVHSISTEWTISYRF